MATKMKYHQYVESGKLYMACKNNCGNYEVVGDPSPISTEGYKKIAKAMAERLAQTAVNKVKAAVEEKILKTNALKKKTASLL